MFLLFSDVHGNSQAVKALTQVIKPQIEEIKGIFIAGDLPGTIDKSLILRNIIKTRSLNREKYAHYVYFEQRRQYIWFQIQSIKKCLEILKNASLLAKPIFYVPGNVDTRESIFFLRKLIKDYPTFHLLQDEWIMTDDKRYCIGGITGAISYIIGSPSDGEFSRGLYEKKVKALSNKLPRLNKEETSYILLTHEAPFATNLDQHPITRQAVGSKALRSLIETLNPFIAVTGHYHENQGISRLDKTYIINPGALTMYQFAIFDEISKQGKFYQLKTPISDYIGQIYRIREQFIK
ncbi:MAG: metallophosphoesterase [Promethearchaeota archaeon]